MSKIAPVLFIVFNRPDTTARVFEAIRQARPARFFVAADGPRNEEENALTEAVRRITEAVDWPCEVHRDYAEENLGCKWRPYSAISWAFEKAEELIILEDDCLPHPDFFRFCSTMLERYRDENRVMHISGDCFLPYRINASYYFTRYTHVWGWATWKIAWQQMDIDMKEWPALKSQGFPFSYLHHKRAAQYWTGCFDNVAEKVQSIWDYQWTYSVWKSSGFCIAPAVNLVSNIGFGMAATHTRNNESRLAGLNTNDLGPIIDPESIAIDERADAWIRDNIYLGPPPGFFRRLKSRLRKFVSNA